MRIDAIGSWSPPVVSGATDTTAHGFSGSVKKALSEVNKLQGDADAMAQKLAAGEPVEIHQAMIAMQKASTALQFTVQVRNRIVDAYQEIMRMQV